MPRSTAARRPGAMVASGNLQPAGEPPANDGAAEHAVKVVPRYVITAEVAAEFMREAMALPADAVTDVPPDAHERLAWMERIQGAAWRDQRELALVHGAHEEPITVADIDTFGARVEWVRGVIVTYGASAPVSAASVATMSEAALRSRLEGHHKTLHNALMYAYRNDPSQRARLRDARRTHSKARLSARSALLLSLCELPATEAWLRKLPRGEGAALDALRVLHPAWVQRLKTGDAPESTAAVDVAARAYATLGPMRERLLDAGRYLTQGRPDRKGDYAGYHRPASRKKKPAAKPPAPPAPA